MRIAKLFQIRKILLLSASALGMLIAVRYAEECSKGIHKGIIFCVEVLVPSLFFFMALSSFIIKSGVITQLTKPLKRISRLLFGLPSQGAAVIILSMIGGYPVGARCSAMMYEQRELSREDAQKVAYIAVCAGPGFVINYIGTALLSNKRIGIILLVSQIIGVILNGVIIGRMIKTKPQEEHDTRPAVRHGSLTVSSVTDASRATFHMCSMVVICSAVIEVISTISPDQRITDLACALIEITEGCHRLCGAYGLTLIAFFIGFGGVCVHLQIFAGLDQLKLKPWLFFLFRIMQGIITALTAYILLMIFPAEQSVFRSTDAPLTTSKSAGIAGSAALILSSLFFLGSVHQKHLRR